MDSPFPVGRDIFMRDGRFRPAGQDLLKGRIFRKGLYGGSGGIRPLMTLRRAFSDAGGIPRVSFGCVF